MSNIDTITNKEDQYTKSLVNLVDTINKVVSGDNSDTTRKKLSLEWEKCETLKKDIEKEKITNLVNRACSLADSIERLTDVYRNVISVIGSGTFARFNGLMDNLTSEFDDISRELENLGFYNAEEKASFFRAKETVETEKERFREARRTMPCGGRFGK